MSTKSEKIKNSIIYFSPNMLKLYNTCPAKFYYKYIEQVSAPISENKFMTGKNIHALASYYLKGADIEKFCSVLDDNEKNIWNKLKSNKYFNYEPVGTEKNVISKLNEFWVGGRVDAIVRDGENYFILDYKTGGVDEDMVYDFQTMVYLFACDKYLGDYSELSLVYLDLKNGREVKVKLTSQLVEEYVTRLTKICSAIENFEISKFVKPESCKCEYINLCKPKF